MTAEPAIGQEIARAEEGAATPGGPGPAAAGRAALAAAQALARRAAPATLRAYKSDWAHYAAWCAETGFTPVPAEPATVGAYIARLAGTHAPATIRRRLAAIGTAHRFNGLPWISSHRDIQGPLQGLLRTHGRPARRAEPLTLATLRQMVATCDGSARGRRDRALLLMGFAGALRRSELVELRVEDVSVDAKGLRVRLRRGEADKAGQGVEIGLPRGGQPDTCPVRAFEAWQEVARRRAGPLFRRISTGDRIGGAAMHPDAVGYVLRRRLATAGVPAAECERLTAHALRVGFITEAIGRGVRDEDIMRHTRHKDLRTMRSTVRRAGLLDASPAGRVDL